MDEPGIVVHLRGGTEARRLALLQALEGALRERGIIARRPGGETILLIRAGEPGGDSPSVPGVREGETSTKPADHTSNPRLTVDCGGVGGAADITIPADEPADLAAGRILSALERSGSPLRSPTVTGSYTPEEEEILRKRLEGLGYL